MWRATRGLYMYFEESSAGWLVGKRRVRALRRTSARAIARRRSRVLTFTSVYRPCQWIRDISTAGRALFAARTAEARGPRSTFRRRSLNPQKPLPPKTFHRADVNVDVKLLAFLLILRSSACVPCSRGRHTTRSATRRRSGVRARRVVAARAARVHSALVNLFGVANCKFACKKNWWAFSAVASSFCSRLERVRMTESDREREAELLTLL